MKNIAVVPFSDANRQNKLFEDNSRSSLGYVFSLLKDLSKNEYNILTVDMFSKSLDEVDIIIFLGLEYNLIFKSILRSIPSIYIAFESPLVIDLHYIGNLTKLRHYFNCLITWNVNFYNNEDSNIIYKRSPMRSEIPMLLPSKGEVKSRKLATQITLNANSNGKNELYSFRKKINKEFSVFAGEDFVYYGSGWGKNPNYGGVIVDKLTTINRFKFTFCIENVINNEGYISEKIYDALLARSVPIYLGETNIKNFISIPCFIDVNDYNSLNDLFIYMSTMNLKEYMTYIKNGDKYLKSIMSTMINPVNYMSSVIELFNEINSSVKLGSINKDLLFLKIVFRGFKMYTYRKIKNFISVLYKNNQFVKHYKN